MGIQKFETEWAGRKLIIETGRYAGQANGACTVQFGDTVVLACATMGSDPREGIDFFPLSVEYEEKLYAAGKIKSSRFIKREGRPTDEAVMTGRMIDRTIRPMFPDGVRHEVQVVLEVLSVDMENDSDIPSLIAASAALSISDIPWEGPLAGARVGRINGEWVLNPTFEARGKSDLDLIVAGTEDRVLMIEAGAKEVSEADMNAGILFGQKHLRKVRELIVEAQKAVGKKKVEAKLLSGDPDETEEERKEKEGLMAKAHAFLDSRIAAALFSGPKVSKGERQAAVGRLKAELEEALKAEEIGKDKRKIALEAADWIFEDAVSKAILEREQRVDGRSLTDIRPLSSAVGLLPRTHGSGLFQRGETQVLSLTTLGGPGDVQTLDGMEEVGKKRYMHHYNFPPYSVGETGRIGGSGRREIGHGGLAEKALMPVLPEKEQFPYTIRVVSEVLSSNGSSSQGSICGSTLSLMDAGVPIKRPVAGIAMGLASDDKGNYKILTDLQDLEDGDGGMDFKIGGTRQGITAIQLDTKTKGLTPEIVEKTLNQAKAARLQILDVMEAAIAAPRPDLSPFAPRIVSFKIHPDRIRDVIGPGGKVINEIIDATGVSIDIENDGSVTICSANKAQLDRAVQWVRDLTREVAVGERFQGKVTRIMDFGAFVEVLPGQEGLVHISELAPFRVNKVTDVVKVGDVIPVVCIKIDELGRINLSLKRAKEQNGETPKQ